MSGSPDAGALITRILEGRAALALRSAAARGALPLPRAALAQLWLHLRNDPEEAIRQDAAASLGGIGSDEVREILADPQCSAPLLAHFAAAACRDEKMAEAVVFHPALPDEALCTLAGQGNAVVVDLVLTNEERLLRTPGVLDRLMANPALRAHQRGRILDLLDRLSRQPMVPAEGFEKAAEPADAEEAARLLEVDVGELFAASEILDGEEFEASEDPEIRNVYRKILTLNTAQKALLAIRGGREERTILVRDTNKVVALSVLRNPRLTESEVEGIATMRNVSDEVLRTIGTHREWVKAYATIRALVHNPRTPPGISTNFVSRLVNKDLKSLSTDKNVPEIIRRMARNTFLLRTQQTPSAFRRK